MNVPAARPPNSLTSPEPTRRWGRSVGSAPPFFGRLRGGVLGTQGRPLGVACCRLLAEFLQLSFEGGSLRLFVSQQDRSRLSASGARPLATSRPQRLGCATAYNQPAIPDTWPAAGCDS